jgi:Prokaryotic homologs of the JAB domain
MLREVCFLIDRDGGVLWADASRSAVALPDSRGRWEAIWRLREELVEIAHSHPCGPEAFSAEDESTMEAIDSALGRPVRYSVVAPRATIARVAGATFRIEPEPWWAHLLRLASGMPRDFHKEMRR